MKFISIPISLLALVFVIGLSPLQQKESNIPVQKEREDMPVEPGWFEQYKRMKGDVNGNIPAGVWGRIFAREAARKTTASNLNNISELGPENVGGRTRSIVYDNTNSNRILAGGVSGGVWETTNGGTTWTPVDDFSQTLSVTGIAQETIQPTVWYYSTGEAAGNSAGIPGAGIFKSMDSGNTFSQLASTNIPAFEYVWSIRTSPIQTDYLYAGTHANGLFRSTDGGTSFESVFYPDSNNTTVNDVEVFNDGSVMIGVNGKGIYKSPTGAAGTFVKLTSNLPVNAFRRIELAYCKNVSTTIYAAIEDSTADTYYTGLKGLYKSINGGLTWNAVANPQDDGIVFYFPWYGLLLSVKPDDANFVMCGGVSLGFSSNGGTSWTEAAYSHADYHTAVFHPTLTTFVLVGNDGGVHRYTTLAMTFSPMSLNNGYNVTQFYTGGFFPTGMNNQGGTQDNGTWKWNPTLSSFSQIYGGDGSFTAVNQQNPLTSYVSWQSGMILRADDSNNDYPGYYDILGQLDADSNMSIDEGAWFINPFEINLLDGNQLYFMTQHRPWRSNDGGINWTPLTDTLKNVNGKSPYCIGISNSASPTVYVGGEQGIFYRIDNAVSALPGSEVNLSSSVPANVNMHFIGCIQVDPNIQGTLLVSFLNFSTEPRIYRVTDANTANPVWTNVSGDLPAELPVNWLAISPNAPATNWYAATDNGLYSTTDGGNTWTKETAIPNVSIHQLRLRSSDMKLFIYTHGRGIWTADVPGFVSTSAPVANAISIYPNPADETVYISGLNEIADYSICDVQGKVVDAGRTLSSIDVSTLPAGNYFLRMNVGERWVNEKMVVF